MNATYCYLAAAFLVLLVWRLWAAGRRRRDQNNRAFQRKVETVLLPRETVKTACPQKKGQWILTSKRLLVETKEGFTALDIKDIKSAYGTTATGSRTTVPGKMAAFTIRAGAEFTGKNTGPEFENLVKLLAAQLKRRRKKK